MLVGFGMERVHARVEGEVKQSSHFGKSLLFLVAFSHVYELLYPRAALPAISLGQIASDFWLLCFDHVKAACASLFMRIDSRSELVSVLGPSTGSTASPAQLRNARTRLIETSEFSVAALCQLASRVVPINLICL